MTFEQILLIAAAVVVVFLIITFIMCIITSSKVSTLMDYAEDGNLTESLKEAFDRLDTVTAAYEARQEDVLAGEINRVENLYSTSIRKTASIHFDAFEDITGSQSFSVAMLDSYNNGFILTSLYGHNSCNTYMREIINGKCSKHLLNEEQTALANALSGKITEALEVE